MQRLRDAIGRADLLPYVLLPQVVEQRLELIELVASGVGDRVLLVQLFSNRGDTLVKRVLSGSRTPAALTALAQCRFGLLQHVILGGAVGRRLRLHDTRRDNRPTPRRLLGPQGKGSGAVHRLHGRLCLFEPQLQVIDGCLCDGLPGLHLLLQGTDLFPSLTELFLSAQGTLLIKLCPRLLPRLSLVLALLHPFPPRAVVLELLLEVSLLHGPGARVASARVRPAAVHRPRLERAALRGP